MEVARNLDKLAAIYTEQKRFAEAQKLSERSLFIWMKELKPGSAELAEKYEKVAELYEALNRPADAEPLVQQVLTARESDTVASLNTLAAIYMSKQNFTEAEPLYRLSLTILDKKGVLTGKRPLFLSSSEDNLELLAQTAFEYADLLKKMKRKSDASKIEARIRAVTGKTLRPLQPRRRSAKFRSRAEVLPEVLFGFGPWKSLRFMSGQKSFSTCDAASMPICDPSFSTLSTASRLSG